MTLDKAIEIAALYQHASSSIPRDDFLDALNLTIEATKRFKALRQVIRVPYTDPLPGETPEIDNKRSLHHIKQTLETNEVSQ